MCSESIIFYIYPLVMDHTEGTVPHQVRRNKKLPPRMKKTSCQEVEVTQARIKKKNGEVEKENKCSNLNLGKTKRPKTRDAGRSDELKVHHLHKLFSPPLSPNVKLKRGGGFWSKKLQVLEENETKNRKCKLYEFSGTDESETSFKIKRKQKPKTGFKTGQQKRQPVAPKLSKAVERANKEKKKKQNHEHALNREQIMLSKERKELADKGKKFTFSTPVQTLGITSTPAVKKDNLIGASNFLFLSPIPKEEAKHSGRVTEYSPPRLKVGNGNSLAVFLEKETPRVETKLKRLSCRRVLRNGKMLDR